MHHSLGGARATGTGAQSRCVLANRCKITGTLGFGGTRRRGLKPSQRLPKLTATSHPPGGNILLLTIDQAAARAHVPLTRIEAAVNSGDLRSVKELRIRAADLDLWRRACHARGGCGSCGCRAKLGDHPVDLLPDAEKSI